MARQCNLEELAKWAQSLGVEARVEEAGLRIEGDRWWGPGVDAWPLGALLGPRRVPVAYPRSTSEVETLVEAAARDRVCLQPRGGGSGVLGALYQGCCLRVDLSRLDWVLVDPEGMYAYTGAGARLWTVEDEASRHGLTTGLEPQSIRVASVGGLVSTLGAGALTPGVGNIEDTLLGLEVVVPGLGMLRLGGPHAPRGTTPLAGPQLYLGHEGGLGIITGVYLRLRKTPQYREGAVYKFPTFAHALQAAKNLVQWNPPSLLRALDEDEARILYGAESSLLLVEYQDDQDPQTPKTLQTKARRVAEANQGTPGDEEILEEWRKNRYNYINWIKKIHETGLWFDTIDLQATWPILPRLNQEIKKQLLSINGVLAAFSHASHFYPNGGSLYTTIIYQPDPTIGGQAWLRVLETARRVGASVTHHHGVGLQKLHWWVEEYPGQATLYCRLLQVLGSGVLRSSLKEVCKCLNKGTGMKR